MSRLHWAARRGFVADVEEAIVAGDPLDERNPNGFTPLELAAQGGWGPVVERLLRAGAALGPVQPGERTALHLAAWAGHLAVVELLVRYGAEVDARTKGGSTPALEAAQANKREVVEFLLSHGADPQATDREDRTVLEWLEVGGLPGAYPYSRPRSTEHLQHTVEFIRQMMAEASSPEEYAARHGRHFLIFSFGSDDLPDPEADRWAKRLAETLRSPGLLAECERRYLSAEVVAEIQRERDRQAKAEERRRVRDELRERRRRGEA